MTPQRAHRALAAVLAGILACTSTACFHVRIEAPPFPENVRLLPADAPVEVRREYQTFYYAWGLFPMNTSDQAKYIIEQERLVEARVVQGGLLEGIIAGFFGAVVISGFVLPQNITVEGNRTPTLPAAEAAK
ncbi:MAG TPA: hypothetical protein VL049_24760 [Candidatus Dormibacteraeota bacterium]|nr:hypothetical protein [Candidatus Dormibacteraeota bacterium]